MLDNLTVVARELQVLGLHDTVFVGGATVGLLITDRAAPPPRHTIDVDIVIPTSSRMTFNALEERLRQAGHHQPPEGPICRWIIAGVTVDLMPPDEAILGFSNRWYASLLQHAQETHLPDGTTIRLASAPHLIATKLEAFHGRGQSGYRFSHDLEDIIILIDGREELVEEIRQAPAAVRAYIAEEFTHLLDNEDFLMAVAEYLPPDSASQARAAIVIERMQRICNQTGGT